MVNFFKAIAEVVGSIVVSIGIIFSGTPTTSPPPNPIEIVEQTATTSHSISTSTTAIKASDGTNSPPVVKNQENFKNQLVTFYKENIEKLRIELVMRDISVKIVQEDIIDHISEGLYLAQNALKNITPADAPYPFFVEVIKMYKLEIAARQTEIKALSERARIRGILKQKLESELNDISQKSFISEPQYFTYKNNVTNLIDDGSLSSEANNNELDMIAENRVTLENILVKILKNEIANLEAETEAAKALTSSSQSIPLFLPSIKQIDLEPIDVRCEEFNKGITCTEFPSMKSTRCDISHNVVTGNAKYSCRSQI